ncbi:MAG: hypothetical protein J6D08_07235 [Lachnospiraceae bacterium]|nr:hypothetical protein [Lachnospiraceae bacterium]
MVYSANIFENYHMTKKIILEHPDTYSNPEYLKLLQAVKVYFDSFVWASDETDRKIYLYSGRKLNSITIADYVGINPNTYRSRVSRISTRLNSILFFGRELSELCMGGSLEDIKETRIYVECLNNRLVMGKELSGHIFEKIHAITANVVEEQPVTEEEKFQAMLLVASFSEPAINNKMSQVNPLALKLVMDELFGTGYSEWSCYYKRMQSKVSTLNMPQQKVIDFCKSE